MYMLIAYDENDNRLYASSGVRYMRCYCPICKQPVRHRIGQHNRPHFAHIAESRCPYDKDSKSEWHIHMQEIFPEESIEIRFIDDTTGEIHIADVFLQQSNTVIEFQHSRITNEEFLSRTLFHVNHGRRIVWIFDERGNNPESEYGRLEQEFDSRLKSYSRKFFRWPRCPRKVLNTIKEAALQADCFSVCVSYGNDDVVHRIIAQEDGFKKVLLSMHDIHLFSDMNSDEFFRQEHEWESSFPRANVYNQGAISRNQNYKVWQSNNRNRHYPL